MKNSIVPCIMLLSIFIVSPVIAQQKGQLKVRFEYGGEPTDPVPINVTKDQAYCGKVKLYEESLIVNEANKGLKNIIVYVYTRGASDFDVEAGDETLTLANDKCRFEPHIVIAQTGDKLKVTNPDQVSHNANLQFIMNNAQNFTIPPGQEKVVDLEEKEPAPIPVECNIHPWMKAYVVVLDHPFAAVSNENGELTIDNLPVGELTFRVWSESGTFRGVEVNGQEISRRNTFDVDIQPGVNDLGTVVMPPVE